MPCFINMHCISSMCLKHTRSRICFTGLKAELKEDIYLVSCGHYSTFMNVYKGQAVNVSTGLGIIQVI